jgi:fructose/tagatose bisphosphate aldolase
VELKKLVDTATEKTHAAERDAVGVAIGRSHGADPVETLRVVSESSELSTFEEAVSQARAKMQSAVTWHLTARKQ